MASTTSMTTSACDTTSEQVRTTWLYKSTQRILTVGDGNFTFSRALARGLKSGPKLTATSYDTSDELRAAYDCEDVLTELRDSEARVYHGVDACELPTTLAQAKSAASGEDDKPELAEYDRIVFQFPLVRRKLTAEEHRKDPNEAIRNRRLLRLFLESSVPLLAPGGEVHITSKIGKPYSDWRIEALAPPALELQSVIRFDLSELDGYNVRIVGTDSAFPVSSDRSLTYIYVHAGNVTEAQRSEIQEVLALQLKGTVPKATIKSVISESKDAASTPSPAAPSRKRKKYDCEICYCSCDREDDFKRHLTSKRHRHRARVEEQWEQELGRLSKRSRKDSQ